MTLSDSRSWPPPLKMTLEAPAPASPRSPPYYPDHLPDMPRSLPRWTRTGTFGRFLSCPARPSPLFRRVGIHDFTFEACSSFTRVTACQVAHPPEVGFVTRLQSDRLPVGQPVRLLVSYHVNRRLHGWFLPPLVICAVGAH